MDLMAHLEMDHMHHMNHGDMGGMDDMGDMDMGNGTHHMMMMMSMSFHFSKSETVLFDGWKFTTVGGLIGSMIGIFFLACIYEGLKYFREYLFWKQYNGLQYRAVSIPESGNVADANPVASPSMLSPMHFFQTYLHVVQMILSYFLMLIFMTYNVWLCIAVVAGAGVGYFLFGWKKSVIMDVTEHCH